MKIFILLLFFIGILNGRVFKFIVKNIEEDYEFKKLMVIFHPMYGNIEFEKNEFLIEILKPLEEKEIIFNYNFKNPLNEKIIVEIKDTNNILLFSNLYELKYKKEAKTPKFNFLKNFINFSLPKDGILKMKIFDISGRKVYSLEENFKKGEYKKDLSFLKPGNYFYEIHFDNKKYKGKFLILKEGERWHYFFPF